MTTTISSISVHRASIATTALERMVLDDIAALDFETTSRLHNLCRQWEIKIDSHLKMRQGVIPVRWPGFGM